MKLEVKLRAKSQTRVRAVVGCSQLVAALLCLFSTSCSLLIDTQKQQCQVNDDCSALGLSEAVCVRELCVRRTSSDSTAGSGAAGSSTTGSRADASSSASESPPQPAASSGAGSSSTLPATSMMMTMSQPKAGTSASNTLSTGSAGMGASAGAAAPSCAGENCCTSDADCERAGLAGGQCIDKLCWAAAAQCSADADCTSQGPEFEGGRCVSSQCRPNPRWRCEAVQATSTTDQKQLTVLVRDSLSLSPVSMVHIVACAKLDLTCTTPVADATTGSDGQLKISVPANFAGYLQQTERSDYAKSMYFLPTAFPDDGVLEPFPLLTAGAIIDALATSLGASTDPSRGHLMLIAEDCDGMAQAGVAFTSPQADAKTVQFYVRDLLPSTSAKQTAEIGNGGYLNFPAGTGVINVDRLDGSMLHLTTVTVVVRAGFISVAYMRPMLRTQTR